MTEKTNTTRDIVLRVEERLEYVAASVKIIGETINGNGKPGLKAEVHDLMSRVDGVETRHCTEDQQGEKKEERNWDLRKTVYVLLITQIISVAGLAISVALGLK
jgi:hypothetical protein